jgi:tripartite-type tricarboxylate transporter receptor subunit TctC
MPSIRMRVAGTLVVAVAGAAGPAAAQEPFPNRPVTIVVPNPPGGAIDISMRALAPLIEKQFRQPVLVVNRPGAASAVGSASVANAKPDGYTVLANTAAVTTVLDADRLFDRKPAFAAGDLVPLAMVTADPIYLAVRADSPHRSVKDLVAAAQAKPGTMVYASSGIYGALHVPLEMFFMETGIRLRHVPTAGGGPAITALLGGHVELTAGGVGPLNAQVQAGKIRLLAGMGAKRSPFFPEVPTLRELGIPVESYLWVGMYTPAGLPDAVNRAWRDALRAAINSEEFRAAMAKVNTAVAYQDQPEFRKWFEAEAKRLSAVMNRIGRVDDRPEDRK